jgi:hypothetical protein
VRVDDPARVAPLMSEIDALFRNSEAITASETEKSYFANFFSMLEGFVTVILIVTGLVALCIVFIAANTASMAVRERLGEIAVLKALGFSRRLIFGTLLSEAVLLSTLGGVLGALGALGLTQILRSGGGWNPALGPLGLHRHKTILVQVLFSPLRGDSRAWCRPSAPPGAAWPRPCARCSEPWPCRSATRCARSPTGASARASPSRWSRWW